jgi:hypothetical protein
VFSNLTPLANSNAARAMAAGRLNNDASFDLILSFAGANPQLRVFPSAGFGLNAFLPPAIYAVDFIAGDLLVQDLNGDGRDDVAASIQSSDEIAVFWTSPAFTLTPGPRFQTGDGPAAIAAADVDHDGDPDLLTSCVSARAVVVHRNLGDETFGPPEPYVLAESPGALAVADFDGDGHADVLTAHWTPQTISILRNRCD